MPETTRDRLREQAEHPTYDMNRHETYAMVTTDDARRLDALVAAVDNQRVRDLLEHSDVDFPECSAAYGAVLEALDAITTPDTGGPHA